MLKHLKISLFITLYCIGAGCPSVYGQNSIHKASLTWKNISIWDDLSGKSRNILFFDEAVLLNNIFLPVYQNKIEVPADIENIDIKIAQAIYESVPDSDLLKIPADNKLTDSITIQWNTSVERKKNYLLYSFIPIRKNRQNGKFERLKYFVTKVDYKLIGLKNKNNLQKTKALNNSVLSTGEWYKFQVDKNGVYQIYYNDLTELGLKNPENVRIYGHGGKNLPEINDGTTPSDPIEIPIMFFNGTDGIFNDGDYFLFYTQGPNTIEYNSTNNTFSHKVNAYTDKVTYFITSSPGGKRISMASVPSEIENLYVTSYDHIDFHEKNLYSLIHSGREYYGELFDFQTSYSFTFDLPNLVSSEQVQLNAKFVARSGITTYFQLFNNNQVISTISMGIIDPLSILGTYAVESTNSILFNATSGENTIKINYDKSGNTSANGWLDYLFIKARQYLKMSGSQLEFRDTQSVGQNAISGFTVDATNSQVQIWEITDIFDVKQMQTAFQNNTTTFKDQTNYLKNYIAFDTKSGLLRPNILKDKGKIENQNLHGMNNSDFVIVTHPDFIEQANRLAALHVKKDSIVVNVVTTEQIYNEFSSGNFDPAAIRNFAKYLYDNANSEEERIQNMLLLGDGSYDNKTQSSGNSNFIPTFQSKNSLTIVTSYVSDDYFGLLDNSESIDNGLMDIGIGRFPVKNKDQADAIVSKIESYMFNSMGSWRNQICFIGDDEDSNIHMQQADQLARYIAANYPTFNIDKIYLDAYSQVSTSSGSRYPDANTAVYNSLNQGVLIMNYTGHGGERGLTSELVIRQVEDVQKWKNKYLPLFITATCEFSRFDDYKYTSAGEDVLLNESGGGIALCSTTRVVYSGPNFTLNYQFYRNAFATDANGKQITLGEIMRRTKNVIGYEINKLNFTLLGDPALRLAVPKYFVTTDSINGNPTTNGNDTIKAYQTVSVKGRVTDISGNTINNFNGTLFPVTFDKNKKVTTLSNDGLAPFVFYQQNDILYKGKASVNKGNFDFSFIVPRDIDYNFGPGKMSFYAYSDSIDASGYYNKVNVGGIGESNTSDNNGPIIELYLNDTLFRNGGITDNFPVLFSKVRDENGINIGGNGIGHDIVAYIDNDKSMLFTLNNYFESDLDNFQSGKIEYNLPEISPGNHTLTLKVWDIFNNSSTATINFRVEDAPTITNIKCFPNPMRDNVYFRFEHNRSGEELDVTVSIFNSSGGKVNELQTKIQPSGYSSGNLPWDGLTSGGNKIKRGLYFYQIKYTCKDGTATGKTQKLIVI
jgi:hypothetical protein